MRWTALLVVMVLAGNALTCASGPGCLRESTQQFLDSRDEDSWYHVLRCATDDDTLDGRVVRAFSEFNRARMRRDLPNSMAQIGEAGRLAARESALRAYEDAVSRVQELQTSTFWMLVKELACQQFDDDLVWSSVELAHVLQRDLFNEIVAGPCGEHEVVRKCVDRLGSRNHP